MEAFRENESSNARANREGLKGWLNPSRYGWERLSYWLMRLTGLFLLLYFIGHVYETTAWRRNIVELHACHANGMGTPLLILVIGGYISFSKWYTLDIC
jgi:succinate dehydrogenase / fumarate reductase cytochrome b subunit